MLASYALSIARRSRGFIAGSAPPSRAATVTSLMRRVKILPFLASAAAFLCLTLAHLECPAMAERRVLRSGKPIILPARRTKPKQSRRDRTPAGDFRGLLPRHRRRDGGRGRHVLLVAPPPDPARLRLRRRSGHAARAADDLLAAFRSRGRGLGRTRRDPRAPHPARPLGAPLSGLHRVLLRQLRRFSGSAARFCGTGPPDPVPLSHAGR